MIGRAALNVGKIGLKSGLEAVKATPVGQAVSGLASAVREQGGGRRRRGMPRIPRQQQVLGHYSY